MFGILSDDFYDELDKKPSAIKTQTALPSQTAQPQAEVPTQKKQTIFSPGRGIFNDGPDGGDFISQEREIQKYGGVVGSDEYQNTKTKVSTLERLPKELLTTLGGDLPEQEVWDRLNFKGKAKAVGKAEVNALWRMVKGLPKEVIKAPIRLGATIIQPWERLARGEDASFQGLADAPRINMKWLGEIPTYFQSYDDARKSGMGPVAASLYTGGTALGDATMVASLAESAVAAAKPRGKIVPGEIVKNTEPIQTAILKDQAGIGKMYKAPEGSVSEYYTLPKTVVKDNFGTMPNNTFLKVTPAGEGRVEVAVVEVRQGTIQKATDWVKNKFGMPDKSYQGNFGKEVKLQSQIVSVAKNADDAIAPLSTITPEEGAKILGSIPPAPLKGFETKPITQDQLFNLDQVSKVNGIEPSIRDAVIRSVTGKNIVGEMTQAEYVKAAQTLAKFNNLSKYAQDIPDAGFLARTFAPQRHWMRTYEENTGVPLYSEVYQPLEEATRVRNVFRESYRNEAREIFGKYAGTGFGEERRLISAYMRGEKDAILSNTTLSEATKADLIKIGDSMRTLYDKAGPQLDVPTDVFLQDYQPRVQNIGGIYQLYKEGSEIPKSLEFFAKFKRRGDLSGVQIDDALALWDIYINSGSNRMFLNPALERISALGEQLPKTMQNSVKNYVQEKLGYAGRFEQFLDSFVPKINKNLGTNLPDDAARQLTNLGLSTMYSGMLSSPATWFRQTFQYPLFGYARLGSRFMGDAVKKGLSKEGLAEAHKAGVLVELGVPFGEELAKDVTVLGKAGNAYKKATQAVIRPNSMADNGMRSIVFQQGKMQWEDALGRYQAGKITWDQFEKDLDFGSFSPIDRNIIRQNLVKGNTEAAFNNYIREIIDETNFPYRRGASSQIGYGLGGKLATSLLQWPIEAASTLTRWVKTGQWDKMIRFYAAGATIARTMKETFGFDFERNLSAGGMFGNWWSPFAKTAIDGVNAINAFMQNHKQDLNENKDSIVRTLKAGGIPGGVLIQNVKKFWRSYDAGPDADGMYGILNDKGEVQYTADFSDLFWGTLMGFPVTNKEESSRLSNDIRNAQFDRSKTKERILELLQQEQYDKASELMQDSGITITPQDMDDYYIPYNQRTFNSLPAQLKAQFAPRVFPDAFNNNPEQQ